MSETIKFNLKSIKAFKSISNTSIALLENEAKIINLPIGSNILDNNLIPNKIHIVLSGKVRYVDSSSSKIKTIEKCSSGQFIGLASLLNISSSENVFASSNVMALQVPDNLVLKMYFTERSFYEWCNSQLFVTEIYRVAKLLYKRSEINNIPIENIYKQIRKNGFNQIIKNDELFITKKDSISFLGSDNVENFKICDILKKDINLKIRGELPARVLTLPQSILDSLETPETAIETYQEKAGENDSSISVAQKIEFSKQTGEKIGQYNPNEKFKLFKATGEVREILACFKMIANEFNLPYRSDSIEKILRDSIRREKKLNMQLLGGITSMMGLHSTTAKIPTKMGYRLPRLSIISWKNSFVIVTESNAKYLEIASPKEGFIKINANDLPNEFEKDEIEILLLDKSDQTPNRKFGLQWLLPSINRYRGVLIQVLVASFVVQLIGLANPLMIQVIIDKVISQRSLDTLEILGFALIFATILGGVLSSLRTFLFNETTNRIDTRLGAQVIDHLLRLPLNYFDRRPVGELGSRIAELEKIRNFLTGQALTTILDAAFSLIYIVVMVIYSWLLTLIALAVVPIQIILTIFGAPLIRSQIREVAKENAKTQSHLVEVLTGIQTVKAQNIENVSRWKWQERYGKYISKSFQKTLLGTALGETSQVLQQLSQLMVLWIGASLVLKGQLSLGQLIAFRIISGYVTQPLLRLSTIWQNIQELRVSFERLADIVDTNEEATESDKAKIPLPSIEGNIKFEDISFAFEAGQPKVLNNINLEIKQGQFVGIVGQSGSGKSTLMKLLPRLYKPNTGRILIDENDIDKVELYSLRRQVGIVPQEPLLFAGTINENIALTDPESASDEIVKVSKVADAHEFIMRLKDGYSTFVGERGAGLSGGQKQRIAIARTLLTNPKLLILDEATSALDYETERKVCDGLKTHCKGSTVFFITHRLNTVKNADLIVMLHEGVVEEIGTHGELMANKRRYFALYRQQESN